jgi:peptidoglycan/LPS O-acetylase OafA/YrhL
MRMVDGATVRSASPNLDLLRSIAVLMVLLDHLCRHFYHDRIAKLGVGDLGTFGVLLFFVHTSLVLMSSMQRSGLTGVDLLKNFYIRRFFRIYPLSMLAVLAAVALHLHANGRGLAFGPRPQTLEFASNLLLVQNLTYSDSIIGPLWSLPIEVQMYLVLPFLFVWQRRPLWGLILLWTVCGFLGHWPQVVPALGWFTLLLYIPNFLPGVIAFTMPRWQIIPAYFWPPFVLLLGVVYALSPSRRSGGGLCLLLGLLIPLFREITFGPLKLLSKWIATYSYGIYLAHSFCIWLALTRFHSWTLFALLIVTLPIALYYGIEHPAIKIGTRLANRASEPELPKELAVPA